LLNGANNSIEYRANTVTGERNWKIRAMAEPELPAGRPWQFLGGEDEGLSTFL
jgi:hypothetical protein